MISRRNIVLAAVVLVLMGLALWSWRAYQEYRAQRVRVVQSAVDLPEGTVIQPGMLGWREMNAQDVERDTNIVRDPQEVIGRVALTDIPAGMVLDRRMLGDRTEPGRVLGSGLTIPVGERAVALPVDLLQVMGGELQAGDHVDIYKAELWITPTVAYPLVTAGEGYLYPRTPEAGGPTPLPKPDGSPRLDYTPLFSDVIVLGLYDGSGHSLGTAKAADQAVIALFLMGTREDAERLLEAAVGGAIRVVLLGRER